MIRQHGKLTFLSFLLVVLCGNTFAQKIPVIPLDLDSLITVGYATGSLKTLSGSVEKITEKQMNKDQVTNPLEAIRGRVPGLTIQRGTNGLAALDAVRLRGTTSLTSGNDPLIIDDGVGLGAAGDEEDVCLGAGAGGAYLLFCAGAVGVGAVAGHLLEVRFRQLLQDGGMRTLAVVVLKIQHILSLSFITIKKMILL